MRDPSDFLIVPSEVDFEFFMRLEILFESDFASNFEQNSLNFEVQVRFRTFSYFRRDSRLSLS